MKNQVEEQENYRPFSLPKPFEHPGTKMDVIVQAMWGEKPISDISGDVNKKKKKLQ